MLNFVGSKLQKNVRHRTLEEFLNKMAKKKNREEVGVRLPNKCLGFAPLPETATGRCPDASGVVYAKR